jgi:two-component system, OmpR family, phosphate regulon response regulator PhoB
MLEMNTMSPGAKVLVVEDEEPLALLLRYNLEAEGYTVDVVHRGDEAEVAIAEGSPDLIVLDWMLPGLSGLELCRRLRTGKDSRTIPIILLTARSEESDRIRGLTTGADDYVVKPFSPAELVARVDAVLRRVDTVPERAPALRFDSLEIDPGARSVRIDGNEVALTGREFDLLLFLARHPGQAFTREQLMDHVWQYAFYTDTSTVTVHVRRLRAKLGCDRWIETVWGVGYRFAP